MMNNFKQYSQYGEENFLNDFFKNLETGFLVDIGAADGLRYSNSRHLIENGWSGLLVEPNLKNFNKLKSLYSDNKNILLENIGCSDITIFSADFFIDKNDDHEQLSTFSVDQVKKCKNMFNCDFSNDQVDILKTSEVLKKYSISKIDFLSIDTESFDTKVIFGIDFDICDINLICVEHTSQEMIEKLSSIGYEVCFKTTGNLFFKKI